MDYSNSTKERKQKAKRSQHTTSYREQGRALIYQIFFFRYRNTLVMVEWFLFEGFYRRGALILSRAERDLVWT